MNKNFFPTKTQTNEISSYIRYKYPFINTLSYQNKNNKIIQKIHFHKLPFQLNNHYTKNINKKNFLKMKMIQKIMKILKFLWIAY